MYGRGVASIAEQIHGTIDEAQKIIDDFYNGFPKVKIWTEKTQQDAKKNGYVEDLWGRRRRLPDIFLPKYTIELINKKDSETTFNPFLGTVDREVCNSPLVTKYQKEVQKVKTRKEYEALKERALKEGVHLSDNSGFIAQAERQCVNARIQGGAATMTKLAMIKLHNDQPLKDLGFKLLIGVHDELIGECPEENAEAVAERLCYVMKTAAADTVEVPFKCDPDIAPCWYLNDYQDVVRKEFKSLLDKGIELNEAFELICNERTESTVEQMRETLHEFFN